MPAPWWRGALETSKTGAARRATLAASMWWFLTLSAVFCPGATLDEGLSAYRSTHVAEARAAFSAVIADPAATGADRAAARRELGRIAWLIDGELAAARRHLESAEAWSDQPCATLALLLRVFVEA